MERQGKVIKDFSPSKSRYPQLYRSYPQARRDEIMVLEMEE